MAGHRGELSRIHSDGASVGRARSKTTPTPSASGNTSSFSTHTRTCATRGSAKQTLQTRSAKPSHKSICPALATSRFADPGYNFLVIDDAPAIFSGERLCSHEVDRNANALLAPTLTRAYSDAAQ